MYYCHVNWYDYSDHKNDQKGIKYFNFNQINIFMSMMTSIGTYHGMKNIY